MRTIFVIFLGMALALSCSKGNKENVIEYTVTPKKGDIVLYGYDINKLMKMNFGELEKVLGVKAKVDSEVAVVFVEKNKDFVKKSMRSYLKDHLEIIYGPINDTAIYRKYLEISPNTIYFSGSFSVQQDSIIKETVIQELKKNLPKNDTTKQIIWDIRKNILFGKYNKHIGVKIYFQIPELQSAKFSICFFKYDKKHLGILYKYIFPLMKEPYPGFYL